MNIKLLAFASASEALGATELNYSISAAQQTDTTVGDLKRALTVEYPNLEELWQRLAVSVDGVIASDAQPLHDGAEVALLPPVSGG